MGCPQPILGATKEQKQNQETSLSKTQLEKFKHCLMKWCTVLCNCLLDKEQAATARIFSLELLPNWVILWGRTESAVHLQKLSPAECETEKYFYSLKKLLVLIVTDTGQKDGISMCPNHFSWDSSDMQIGYSLVASLKFTSFPDL